VQVRTKQLDIAGAEEQVARLEGLLKEAKGATDKVQKEFNTLSEKVSADHGAAPWRSSVLCSRRRLAHIGHLRGFLTWQLFKQAR
jgi:FPC/CPF motif-containing protein YcgG